MTDNKYNDFQIEELKNNINVKNCTKKHIVFTKEFKYKSLELAKKYISAKEIFMKFWFPEYVVNSEIPSNSLARWKKLSKKWVVEETKWRPKKEENIDFSKMNLKQQNEYLRTENLYLKELHKQIYWEYP